MAESVMSIERQPRRVLFYVQHLLGIGHLARASRIGRAMVEAGLDVTMVTGGTPVEGFPGPEVKHIALPPIASGDAGFSGLVDAEGKPVDAAFEAMRRDLLLQALHDTKPDIVMIEAFPFGRRQVRFELIPLLDAIRSMPDKPLVACSLRDILQERAKSGRDQESVDLVERYFDRVLVHGDPAFVRLEETFPLAGGIADKIVYTGLVSAPLAAPPSEQFDIVVSAGGGAVGNGLLRAAAGAASRLAGDLTWCIISGPNLPQSDYDAVGTALPANARLVRFRKDFASLLTVARVSVSQAGYNTVCDILRAGCGSVLIPFTAGGETEQRVRAERLEKLGLAAVVEEETLSVDGMTAAVSTMLASRDRAHHSLDLEGAKRTAEILAEMPLR
ncbi:MAG: undecaprenyldiphospho-muramoylpentapeptide beta-N-acetylglucosaminyltransferase [Rhizobium sp.]|nr:undecaprenyldiphospho-muramoylpentapeptide beta-N-acetylglucosaminyltransferase [Rhizobium sp.]